MLGGGAGGVTAAVLHLAGMGGGGLFWEHGFGKFSPSVEGSLYFCFSLEQLMWGSHAGGLWGGSAAQAVLGLLSFCLQRRFLALC